MNRFDLTEGVFLYVLGVVIVATRPGRFWLGLALALTPIVVGPAVRTLGGRGRRRA